MVSVQVFVAVNGPSGADVILVPVADKHRFQPNVQLFQNLPQLFHVVTFIFLTRVQQYPTRSGTNFVVDAIKIKIIVCLLSASANQVRICTLQGHMAGVTA